MTRAAVGIVWKNGTVLACQRKRNARYGLKWEFPGGKVEKGETAEQCLARELREELSITARDILPIETTVSHYDDGGSYEVVFCHVTGFDGEPANNVFEQIRWVKFEDLRRLDFLEGNVDFIARLQPPANHP